MTLQPKSGAFDVSAWASKRTVAARLEYMHRLDRRWGVYGYGSGEWDRVAHELDYSVGAGVRGSW